MNDFFTRQDQARRSTTVLLGYFCLAVILIILSVYLAARGVLLYASTNAYQAETALQWWDLQWFLWTAGSTAAIIFTGALYQTSQLRAGGKRIAELLDARRVAPASEEPRERQLLNIVEEMAIAAGTPVPEVYVMDRERAINAFAAGFSSNDGCVCVTRGALELLTRQELQGVIAHEFSHLLNGDTLINLRLVGWLYGILLLSQIGGGLMRSITYSRRGRGQGPFIALGIILWALGSIGYLFGQLIKSAVSRQREQLADASAVQFTRNPLGLAGALKKMGGLDLGSRLHHPQAALASHMFFGNGLKESWLRIFATHPPLEERILLLDPAFDGRFPEVSPLPAPTPHPGYVQRRPSQSATTVLSGAAVMALLEKVGTIEKNQLLAARAELRELPPPLRQAARSPLQASALIYALLLHDAQPLQREQLLRLEADCDVVVLELVTALRQQLRQVTEQTRLMLIDLALPTLRSLSARQYRSFRQQVRQLSDADQKISLFEYALQQILLRPLDRQFLSRQKPPIIQIYAMRGIEQEASLILSLLAHLGHSAPEQRQAGFQRGATVLNEPRLQLQLLPQADCTRVELDRAMARLEQVSPQLKNKLLAGCLQCLTADGEIKLAELELFRALAAAMDCPVPPWLQQTGLQQENNDVAAG